MRITLRDINGQLPGAILFINFLSSRKDHVRHENYSQRHKWPATWGYLVYEYNKVSQFVLNLCVPMERSQVIISKKYFSLKINFVSAKGADPMKCRIIIWVHCLPKFLFWGFRSSKG